MSNKIVEVGVAVFAFNDADEFLMLKRRGSLGAGTWGLIGGKPNFGESMFEAAHREGREEADIDLEIEHAWKAGWSECFYPQEDKHFVSIFVVSRVRFSPRTAKIMEPDKCSELCWVPRNALPDPLFSPLAKYLSENDVPRPR